MIEQARARCPTVDHLAALFFTAAETNRALPSPMAVLRDKGSWPEIAPDRMAYGYNETEIRRGPATARQISDYDLACELLPLMEVDEAKLVWAAAATAAFRQRGPNWRKVARWADCHPATAKRRFMDAILRLHYRLESLQRGRQ